MTNRMINDFGRILDECLDRLSRGESPEACLADYPEYAEQLKPLLQATLQTKAAYSIVPSASAKRAARQKFNAAREMREQRRNEKLFARPISWATIAAVLLILVAGYFGFRHLWFPSGPVPNPEGNFVFLISDEVNAIGDFERLSVSISRVGLLSGGDSGGWIEFEPVVREVDLTLVPGDKTQEIWRGNVPESQYSEVFIYVDNVYGILKESGQTVEVKLPSSKLHISKPFEVTADTVTSFTYDLTVVAAGQDDIKYILKPQISQSGAEQKPSGNKAKNKKP